MARDVFSTLRFAAAAAACGLLLSPAAGGCASTEYINEGPGQPTERASGAVPPGSVGVCKRPLTKRPPIVSQQLWDDARPCTGRTPPSHVRLGYARFGSAGQDPEAEQIVERILAALAQGTQPEAGNNEITNVVRAVRAYAARSEILRDRVTRESPSERTCDFAYLLNTMSAARAKLTEDRCTAQVFDPVLRKEVCLFDESRAEILWMTSGWDCVTFTGAIGNEQSCHRLCAYDDYCARQVSCAAGDLDLLLCTMGVCLPEPRAGF